MDAREAEIEVLAVATGTRSELVATDLKVLRKMRHADEQPVAKPPAKGASKRSGQRGAA
jgi:hypothetical protein